MLALACLLIAIWCYYMFFELIDENDRQKGALRMRLRDKKDRPKEVRSEQPVYPQEARRIHVEGGRADPRTTNSVLQTQEGAAQEAVRE